MSKLEKLTPEPVLGCVLVVAIIESPGGGKPEKGPGKGPGQATASVRKGIRKPAGEEKIAAICCHELQFALPREGASGTDRGTVNMAHVVQPIP